jgi:hypothetical protein
MTEQHSPEATSSDPNASALFAQLILQQSNMAMMLLGKVAHHESGQTYKDVEAARMFIDQLEMLEAKTKGNLTKEETSLLKQSLMNLRLAFVEAVESPESQKLQPKQQPGSTTTQTAASSENASGSTTSTSEEEHRKKFSKKY